ncbi:hypothetical protein EV182_001029 [Spiromyces aspiralis]|uniref:Uncharacterized protein n=1 Tax=Spiromyces aspiralis TaxID=68401 RepID=A0ACC1HGU4_9FUNG|nr:hypothetical protein EV182_001029 [Spiromyces aspiralis]
MERAGLPYGVLYQGVDDAGIESDPVGSPAYCDRFRRYAGGSAAQSSLIQVLDIALGVTHYPTNINSSRSGSPLSAPLSPTSSSHRQSLVPPTPPSEGDDPERPPLSNRHPDLTFPPPPASPNSYLLRMRDYMPGPHRRFLEDLAKVCRIREYVVNAICGGSETRYCEQASRRLHEAYNICVQRLKQFRDHHIQIVTRYIVIPARKGATVIRPPVTSSAPPSPVPVPAAAAAAAATAKPKPMDRVHTLAGQDAIKGDTGRNHYLGLRLHSPPASPPLSEFSPRSKNLPFTYGKGPQGGYSPSSEAIMYPQTNSPPTPLSASAAYHQNWQGAGLGLARQAEGGEVLRGTGGTDAIKFLKQVRDETKSSYMPLDEEREVNEKRWYTDADSYWKSISPTVDGMLGGLELVHEPDISDSKAFLEETRNILDIGNSGSSCGKTHACDCGAGIGRVSKHFLLTQFDTVDLIEQNPEFLRAAEDEYLRDECSNMRVQRLIPEGLQTFTPLPGEYDVIWCQWVLSHLTDADLVKFLGRCKAGLKRGGFIGIKENVISKGNYEYDDDDSSVTRSIKIFERIFEQAKMRIVHTKQQKGFPRMLYRVQMWALQPLEES